MDFHAAVGSFKLNSAYRLEPLRLGNSPLAEQRLGNQQILRCRDFEVGPVAFYYDNIPAQALHEHRIIGRLEPALFGAAMARLEKAHKFVDGQTGLLDDRFKGSSFHFRSLLW